jgi:hypothetical protein
MVSRNDDTSSSKTEEIAYESLQSHVALIDTYLKELEFTSRSLRFYSLLIAVLTISNMFFFLGVFVFRDVVESPAIVSVQLFNLGIFSVVIAVIVLFDRRRRRGNGLFEEISNEIQSLTGEAFKEMLTATTVYEYNDAELETMTGLSKQVKFNARVTLRDFTRSAELPLVPGNIGPVIYFVFNLLITMIALSNFARLP